MRARALATHRGYTLVEVLVVITILGILGTMVIPSFGGSSGLRTQAAVRAVVADITFAQSDALAYQEGRAVMFNEEENYYTIVQVLGGTFDEDDDALYDPHGPGQRYRVDLDDPRYGGAKLANVEFNGGESLIFDELGGPTPSGADSISTGGSLEVAGPDSRYRVTVAPFTGRVTVLRLD